jgi:hypothetical protein
MLANMQIYFLIEVMTDNNEEEDAIVQGGIHISALFSHISAK